MPVSSDFIGKFMSASWTRQQYPASVVSTICAMPISRISDFPNEQEVLLRGTSFQLLRIYEEPAADHTVHVLEMIILNANRDHCTKLAFHHGNHLVQRVLFGRMCAATKYGICASLAEEYGMPKAKDYARMHEETLALIGWERTMASLETAHFDTWATPRPSWIGASVVYAFPESYARRRQAFSKALYHGGDLSLVDKIIDNEYDWQKSDWCNVSRLFSEITTSKLIPLRTYLRIKSQIHQPKQRMLVASQHYIKPPTTMPVPPWCGNWSNWAHGVSSIKI